MPAFGGSEKIRCLNLGCGDRFHPQWTNLDLTPSSPNVSVYDCREPLPFEDESFDVVYHSHVIEHLRREDVIRFLRECCRVLRPGGILRVAIPDLEGIARAYLECLEKAVEEKPGSEHDYHWMMLELFDQTVRERSGGAMLEYLRRDPISNEPFVLRRMGGEARRIISQLRPSGKQTKPPASVSRRGRRGVNGLLRALRHAMARMFLTEKEVRALELGQFRFQGEVHQWMYDRYSLKRLLEEAGFQNPTRRSAFESAIPNWLDYHLDTEPDGSVYKPDSLYMEAVRPAP
jgi:predicted SAM-dependent methyltransferase